MNKASLNPGKVFPALHRCAELGPDAAVHHGGLPLADLPQIPTALSAPERPGTAEDPTFLYHLELGASSGKLL